VSREFETWTALAFLVLAISLSLAQDPPTRMPSSPEITISVHDYADVRPELLAAAQAKARRIFRQAGVETVWLTCSPKLEKTQPDSCSLVDPTHLVLKILPHAFSEQVRDRNDVLGNALLDEKGTGYYAYAFLDHIQILEQRLGFALLGDVLAHEIGHLLLGSNSHSVSGIMSAHWNGTELRNISEGSMCFLPSQSRVLRDRLGSRQIAASAVTSARAGD
jgi:hypothetical protein